MRSVRIVLGGALVLALTAAAIGLADRRGDTPTDAGPAPRAGLAVPAATPSRAAPTPPPPPEIPPGDPDLTNATPGRGVAGIRPSRTPTSPDEAAFTDDEVRAFITARGGNFGRVKAEGPFEIDGVNILRAADAPAKLGVTAGSTDDQLVCAATLRGTFVVPGPFVPSKGPTAYKNTRMLLIFDARSGNLLEQIALP